MPIRLDTRSADFGARFHAFLGTKRETSQDVEAAVRAIVADVVAGGEGELV
jgi:histidinol dehydrogenase